jgi:hypothetical protein
MNTTLHLFEAATGKEVRRFAYGRPVFTVVWSPDSSSVAIVGGFDSTTVSIWDARTGEIGRSWQASESGSYGVAFSADGRYVATGGDERDSSVRVWEQATGSQVAVFEGHHSAVLPVAFAPDQRTLVSGGGDATVLLWDLTGRSRDGKLRPATISPARFASLWEKLGETDGAAANAAVWELVAGGKPVLAMLKAKLPVAAALDAGKAAKLVARLDSDDYETREQAMKEGAKLGLGAEPALRKALGSNPNLEPRKRVDALVSRWLGSADWLAYRRGIAVLEYSGSEEAKAILTALAGGAKESRPVKEAEAALGRLGGKAK